MKFEGEKNNIIEKKEKIINGLYLEGRKPLQSRHDESIIFIHGSGMNHLSGRPIIETFSQPDYGYKGFSFSLRGHTKSETPEKFTQQGLAMYYEDLKIISSYLEKNENIEDNDRILWGHSMGGLIAMQEAKSSNPHAIVLMGSALPKKLIDQIGLENIYPDQTDKELEYLKMKIENNEIYQKPSAKIKNYFANRLPDDFAENYENLYAKLLSQESNQARLEATTEPPDVNSEDISCPILVVAGENDPAISITHSEKLAEFFNAKLLRTEFSHLGMFDKDWPKVASDINKWLEKIKEKNC